MTIYRNFTPNITKGQKRLKWSNIKMLIEISFMSAIFGMFTQFIYPHMTIYEFDPKYNQTPKNGQKGSKKGKKNGKN